MGRCAYKKRRPLSKKRPSDVWLGIGEAHTGDLVAFGCFNWNARIYRLDASEESEVEYANLVIQGYKLGGGVHVWVGRKYATTKVEGTGVGF